MQPLARRATLAAGTGLLLAGGAGLPDEPAVALAAIAVGVTVLGFPLADHWLFPPVAAVTGLTVVAGALLLVEQMQAAGWFVVALGASVTLRGVLGRLWS